MPEFIDHLKEHMTELARKYVEGESQEGFNTFPPELMGIEFERLIQLIADEATPILRKIEDDAIAAAIEKAAALIRYSWKKEG